LRSENADFTALEMACRGRLAGGVYRWGSDANDRLKPHFEILRSYYAGAAEEGMAIFMWRS
jgi:hypothetical protein